MVIKTKLHPRNQHSEGYDFVRLVVKTPELESFMLNSPVGQPTIDFQDARAVRMLNRALLKTHYNIDYWDIPAGYRPAVSGLRSQRNSAPRSEQGSSARLRP